LLRLVKYRLVRVVAGRVEEKAKKRDCFIAHRKDLQTRAPYLSLKKKTED
jgi:hypothetical protein